MKCPLIRIIIYITLFIQILSTNIVNKQEYKEIKKVNRYNLTDHPVEIGFKSSLLQTFTLITFSEIFDKTFLICVIFSMKIPRIFVLSLSMLGILLMNFISITIGLCIPIIIYPGMLLWISIFTFFLFGVLLLNKSRIRIPSWKNKILEHKQFEDRSFKDTLPKLKKRNSGIFSYYYLGSSNYIGDKENNIENKPYKKLYSIKEATEEKENISSCIESRLDDRLLIGSSVDNTLNSDSIMTDQSNLIYFWFFCSILVAEFGDRSQISLIIISGIYNTAGVLIGSVMAHLVCITLSIFFSRGIMKAISEQTMLVATGILMLIYAAELFVLKMLNQAASIVGRS